MTEEQFKTIIGLITGIQFGVAHLANVLCAKTGADHETLATSFEEVAEKMPPEVANGEMIRISLRHIAYNIRSTGNGDDWNDLLKRLQL